jgi:SAM-dependent methyltransferase
MTWQEQALKAGLMDDPFPKRRVHGPHDLRFDGLSDLLMRVRGKSVLDVGCNRGHTLYDMGLNGAAVVHGCDIFGPGMAAARQWFIEVRDFESRFETVDLSKGPAALEVFGDRRYHLVMMLGVYHKLKRVMPAELLSALMQDLGNRTIEYFAWNGYAEEMPTISGDLARCGLTRVHLSELPGGPDRPAAIWQRLPKDTPA